VTMPRPAVSLVKTAARELASERMERGLNVTHETCSGDVATVALRRARELDADLVVVGAAGPGSVAEEIARRAPCPVLIVGAHPAPANVRGSPGARSGEGPAD
jgi:nucleotide-binding universal stress UspA family protein